MNRENHLLKTELPNLRYVAGENLSPFSKQGHQTCLIWEPPSVPWLAGDPLWFLSNSFCCVSVVLTLSCSTDCLSLSDLELLCFSSLWCVSAKVTRVHSSLCFISSYFTIISSIRRWESAALQTKWFVQKKLMRSSKSALVRGILISLQYVSYFTQKFEK